VGRVKALPFSFLPILRIRKGLRHRKGDSFFRFHSRGRSDQRPEEELVALSAERFESFRSSFDSFLVLHAMDFFSHFPSLDLLDGSIGRQMRSWVENAKVTSFL
jgi:hypothetical protein